MNKTKIVSSLITISLVALPIVALAQGGGVYNTQTPGAVGLQQIINNIATFMWVIFGIVALIAFISAGILFLTAGGQPEKIAAARQSFIWGVAGVVVAVIAYSIVTIIRSFVTTGS